MSIPKIIHYCWLSGEEFPADIKECIDSWKNIKSSKEETKRINKMEVLVLFKRIIQSTIVKQKYDNAWFYTTTQELFDFDREELMNKPLTDLVSEKIKTYKYTIDYFK